MNRNPAFMILFRAAAWLAAGTMLFFAAHRAEARSAGRETQSHAAATIPGLTSNDKASTYMGCGGGGRCPAKLPSNPPRRPTIPDTNGPAKNPCAKEGGWHHPGGC